MVTRWITRIVRSVPPLYGILWACETRRELVAGRIDEIEETDIWHTGASER